MQATNRSSLFDYIVLSPIRNFMEGLKQDFRRGMKRLFWFVVIVGGVAVTSAIFGVKQEPKPQLTPEQIQAKKEADRLASDHADKIIAMSRGLVQTVYSSLRDPHSMQVSQLIVYHKPGVERVTGCMQYHARNGFGGMNKEFLVAVNNGNGDIRLSRNDTAAWNKLCGGYVTSDDDHTDLGKSMLERMKN